MRRRVLLASMTSAALSPGTALAQQPQRVPRIGYLSLLSAANNPVGDASFLAGLRDLGYVDGRNIHIDFRYANGDSDKLPALAAELVALNVDVIVAYATGVPIVRRAARSGRSRNRVPCWRRRSPLRQEALKLGIGLGHQR